MTAVLGINEVCHLTMALTHSPNAAAKAASVIMAESDGNPVARCHNVRDPASGRVVCAESNPTKYAHLPVLSVDRGLCQFNNLAHPEVSDAAADDPQRAVKAMYAVSGGFVDFHQWSSYGTDRQKAFEKIALDVTYGIANPLGSGDPSPLGAATGAVGGALVGGASAVGDAASGVVHAAKSIPDFLGALSNPHTWVRVLYVVGGVGAIAAGALMLGKDLSPLGDAAAAVGHATASKVGASSVAAGSFTLA